MLNLLLFQWLVMLLCFFFNYFAVGSVVLKVRGTVLFLNSGLLSDC